MSATDRAREWLHDRAGCDDSCAPWERLQCKHDRDAENACWNATVAALDFADAVEAALPRKASLQTVHGQEIRAALRAFLAQLDRATGGGA